MLFPLSSRVWTSAFAHRNPPRSLWLQHIHWMCCLTRRAHITVPPLRDLEGTHGDRVAGDNTQRSHRLLSFSFYVTRSRTKKTKLVRSLVLFRQARRSLSRRRCCSCSVFEVAHTVYKYALNKCSFIHLRALHAKHQASTRTELRFEFLSLSF